LNLSSFIHIFYIVTLSTKMNVLSFSVLIVLAVASELSQVVNAGSQQPDSGLVNVNNANVNGAGSEAQPTVASNPALGALPGASSGPSPNPPVPVPGPGANVAALPPGSNHVNLPPPRSNDMATPRPGATPEGSPAGQVRDGPLSARDSANARTSRAAGPIVSDAKSGKAAERLLGASSTLATGVSALTITLSSFIIFYFQL
jgi:hypothetical protein